MGFAAGATGLDSQHCLYRHGTGGGSERLAGRPLRQENRICRDHGSVQHGDGLMRLCTRHCNAAYLPLLCRRRTGRTAPCRGVIGQRIRPAESTRTLYRVAGKFLGLGLACRRTRFLFLYPKIRLAQRVFNRRAADFVYPDSVEIPTRIRTLPALARQNGRSAPAGQPLGRRSGDDARRNSHRTAATGKTAHPFHTIMATAFRTAHADAVAGLVRHRLFLLRHFYLAAETLGRTRQYGGQNL